MNLGMPPTDWEVRARDKCTCCYCGLCGIRNFDVWLNQEIDHIILLTSGGDESAENKATVCFECNHFKSNYLPTGSNREERIADARRHVQASRDAWRERYEMMMGQIEKPN